MFSAFSVVIKMDICELKIKKKRRVSSPALKVRKLYCLQAVVYTQPCFLIKFVMTGISV